MNSTRSEFLKNLYYHGTVSDLTVFYNHFHSIEELLEFFRSLPKGPVHLHQFNVADSVNVICVVPTPDVKDENTVKFIKGMSPISIVAVESSGPFFNFAHSMNIGIEEALKKQPKWIILSNNDISPATSTSNLIRVLETDSDNDILIPRISYLEDIPRHSFVEIYKQSLMARLIYENTPAKISKMLPVYLQAHFVFAHLPLYANGKFVSYNLSQEYSSESKLLSAFLNVASFVGKWSGTKLIETRNVQPISIVSSKVLQVERFDETFSSGGEDLDLSIRLKLRNYRLGLTDITFKTPGGASLNKGIMRMYRNTIPEIAILGWKLKNEYGL